MTPVLPELRALPDGLVLDGELVAWKVSEPSFPFVCRRILHRDMSVPLTFVIFDLLRRDGVDLTGRPYDERRSELGQLGLDGIGWATTEAFDDGRALTSRPALAMSGSTMRAAMSRPCFSRIFAPASASFHGRTTVCLSTVSGTPAE